jgi:hypothetical protein
MSEMIDEPMTPPTPTDAPPDPTEAELAADAPDRECPNVEAGVAHEPHLYDFADAATSPDQEWGNCPGLAES